MNATDHLDWLLTLKLPTGDAKVGFGVSANVFPDILLKPLAKFFDPIPWLTVDGERYLPYSDWCEFLSKERKRFHLSMREESAELGRRGNRPA